MQLNSFKKTVKMTLFVIALIFAYSLAISIFTGFSIVSMINNVFLTSIPLLGIGVFRKIYEIGMLNYLNYSLYAVGRFLSNLGMMNKNLYVDEVERENLDSSKKTDCSSSEKNIKKVKSLDDFMRREIRKSEYTMPMIYASLITFAISSIVAFLI